VKNGETHQGGRVTETDGSSDVSNPSPYTAHREPAYLLERVCTGYKNGLAVGGFKGKRGWNGDFTSITFTNDVGDEMYTASLVSRKRDTTRRRWTGFMEKLGVKDVSGTV
jgi:hypothetical protein